MKVISLNCPNCGIDIKVNDNQNSCICPACGSSLMIDDGKFHIVDEARIKEIDFEKQKYEDGQKEAEKRKQRREKWKGKCKKWTIMEIVAFGIASIIGFIYQAFPQKALLYLAYPFAMVYAVGLLFGPIYLAITRPDADYESNNPPLIKSKWVFGLVLFIVGYLAATIAGRLLTIRF